MMKTTKKLGTHNSWSYGKTKWLIPAFWAKCQKLSIQEQYSLGARLFDLRLRRKKDNSWGVSHGSTFFDVDYLSDLEWLNEKGDVYVRVLLEYNSKPKDVMTIESQFYDMCAELSSEHKGIKFYGANPKYDSLRTIFDFGPQVPKVVEKVSSTTSLFGYSSKFFAILDDWCPWIYARLHNKENYKEFCEGDGDYDFLLTDFIDMMV